MTSPADVTVVVPFYNASATLGRALASVAAQSVPAARVVVVDDASRPEERAAAARIASRYPNTELAVLPVNGGPSQARNHGWDLADTEWVALLDADDEWHPDRLARQLWVVEQAKQNRQVAPAMVCNLDWEAATPGQAWPRLAAVPAAVDLSKTRLLVNNPLPTSSVLLRTDLPFRFTPTRRLAEDHELWLRIAASGERIVHVPERLCRQFKVGVGQSGLTANVAGMIRSEYEVFVGLVGDGTLTVLEGWWGLVVLTARVARRLVRHALSPARRGGRPARPVPTTAAR